LVQGAELAKELRGFGLHGLILPLVYGYRVFNSIDTSV
jgi:hypothetical protein